MQIRRVAATAVSLLLACVGSSDAAVVTYRCSFPTYADRSGIHSQTGFAFSIQYDDISGNAAIVGNIGMSPATPIVSANGAAFIEVTSIGAVMTTTVALDGQAVHSRHTLIVGTLEPSQHYGTCPISD